MDVVGLEFSYLDNERSEAELARRNRMAVYGDYIRQGGSAELSREDQIELGRMALLLTEHGVDLLSAPEIGDMPDDALD